jgi:hypothetical protein
MILMKAGFFWGLSHRKKAGHVGKPTSGCTRLELGFTTVAWLAAVDRLARIRVAFNIWTATSAQLQIMFPGLAVCLATFLIVLVADSAVDVEASARLRPRYWLGITLQSDDPDPPVLFLRAGEEGLVMPTHRRAYGQGGSDCFRI